MFVFKHGNSQIVMGLGLNQMVGLQGLLLFIVIFKIVLHSMELKVSLEK